MWGFLGPPSSLSELYFHSLMCPDLSKTRCASHKQTNFLAAAGKPMFTEILAAASRPMCTENVQSVGRPSFQPAASLVLTSEGGGCVMGLED